MNYRLSTQAHVLYLKTSADRLEFRVERKWHWDTELLVGSDGISHRRVKLIFVLCHRGCVAGGKHVNHSKGKRLSQSENVSQDYLMGDQMTSHQ